MAITLQELAVVLNADVEPLKRAMASGSASLNQVAEASKKADVALQGVAAAEKKVAAAAQQQAAQSAAVAAAVTRNAAATQNLAKQATVATAGLNSVRGAMTSVAGAALGAAPGIAPLAGIIGSLAIGTPMMIGVMAGAAALAFAWDKITASAREAKKATEEAIDALTKAGQASAGGGPAANLVAAIAEEDRLIEQRRQLQLKLAEQSRPNAVGSTVRLGDGRAGAQKELADIESHLQRVRNAITHGRALLAAEDKQAADKRLAAQKAAASALEAAANKAQGQADMVRQAQQAAALAAAQGDSQERLKIAFSAVNKEIAARRDLTGEMLRITLRAIEAERQLLLLNQKMPSGQLASRTVLPQPPQIRVEKIVLPPKVTKETPFFDTRAGQAIQAGAGGSQLMQMAQAAAAFGPFAALIPVVNGALEKLAPVIAKIIEPLATIGAMLATTLEPGLKLAAWAAGILAKAFSYVMQAIGWFVRSLGKIINLLPGSPGNPLVNFGQEMIDSAREAREGLNGVAAAANNAANSITNMPEIFDLALRRRQAGMGGMPGSADSGGGVGGDGYAGKPSGPTFNFYGAGHSVEGFKRDLKNALQYDPELRLLVKRAAA